MTTEIAVITGATRGIGRETARQLGARGFRLIITGTRQERADAAVSALAGEGYTVAGHALDQGDDASVEAFTTWLKGQTDAIDVLINCAGIYPEKDAPEGGSVLAGSASAVLDTFNVNTFGPWRLTRALAPMIRDNGRIINVSSSMASLSRMAGGSFGYRASKTALNALTRLTAMELADRGIMVNSIDPGWVKTDMGGPAANLEPEESAEGLVWAATLEPGGPSGGYYFQGETQSW